MKGFQKGHAKKGGRKPGSVNKTTASVKAALTEAFEKMGGVKSLVKWGSENQTSFYTLWARMLPTEIKGLDGGQAAWADALREAIRELARRDSEEPAGSSATLQITGGAGCDGHAPGVADTGTPGED